MLFMLTSLLTWHSRLTIMQNIRNTSISHMPRALWHAWVICPIRLRLVPSPNLNVESVSFEERKFKMKNGIKFPIVFLFIFPKTLLNCPLPVLKDLAVNGNIRVLFSWKLPFHPRLLLQIFRLVFISHVLHFLFHEFLKKRRTRKRIRGINKKKSSCCDLCSAIKTITFHFNLTFLKYFLSGFLVPLRQKILC